MQPTFSSICTQQALINHAAQCRLLIARRQQLNNHLREQAKQAPIEGNGAGYAPFRPPPPARPSRWRKWAVVAAVVFGLYVFAGHFVLKTEVQWPTISGQILGRSQTAAINESTPAQAAAASAIEGARAAAGVKPAIDIADGQQAARVRAEDQIARFTVRTNRQNADTTVETEARTAKIKADAAARTQESSAYQSCLDRARTAAESARTSTAADPSATLAMVNSARDFAFLTADKQCEGLRQQQDAARRTADSAAVPLSR
jgi:hypothetical protein